MVLICNRRTAEDSDSDDMGWAAAEVIRKSIAISFRKCLRAYINAKGGHFEHTL